MKTPLISALCVTHRKPLMLKRAISCFMNQSYPQKQLVVVYESNDEDTRAFLGGCVWNDNLIGVTDTLTNLTLSLGALRNISINEADGDYICQWDDDDWYDEDRMAVQIENIISTDKPACVLSQWVVFDAMNQKAYLSNRRLWEGSIMCRKDIIQQKLYPEITIGEDTEVIEYLLNNDLLTVIHNAPELYIYVYHGTNTWEYTHFAEILNVSIPLSKKNCNQIIEILNSE